MFCYNIIRHDNDAKHEEKIQYLFQHMLHHKYAKNDIIISKGDICTGIHIVVSGQCTIRMFEERETKEENSHFEHDTTVTKGVFFPTWAYLTQQPCQHSIFAHTAVETCFIPNATVQYLLEDKDLNEIIETEAYLSLWKTCGAYLLWLKHKHIKRNNIIDLFFNTLSKTEINIICQKSTFKEFKSGHEMERTYLNNSYLMILLYGQCFYFHSQKKGGKDESERAKEEFHSGDMLLPYPKPYRFTKGSKILILDYNIKHSLPSPMKRINRAFTFRKL